MWKRYSSRILIVLALGVSTFTAWLSAEDFKTQGWDDGKISPSEFPVVKMTIETDHPVFETDERFLSVNIDWAQVVGAPWWNRTGASERRPMTPAPLMDFQSPALRRFTQALGPMYLRVGGSSGDDIGYSEHSKTPYRLTEERWNEIRAFAHAVGARLVVGINGGPSSRGVLGEWRPETAQPFLQWLKKNPGEVEGVELGNEANAYAFRFGISHFVGAAQWAKDLTALRAELAQTDPAVKIMGTASAFWPVLHEPLSWFYGLFNLLADRKGLLDVLTWHYYPTESSRCSQAIWRATPFFSTNADRLNEWRRQEHALESHRAGRPMWLGETGPAQCGGQPGVSDRFVSSLWWVDQLGMAAREGQAVVVRESLSDLDYGLLSGGLLSGEIHTPLEAYEPRPDYWASLAWRSIMGTRALAIDRGDWAGDLRSYAHCLSKNNPFYRSGGLALLFLNLSQSRPQKVDLNNTGLGAAWSYTFTAMSPFSKRVLVNGSELSAPEKGDIALPMPLPQARRASDALLEAPPLSYTFVVFPGADLKACR